MDVVERNFISHQHKTRKMLRKASSMELLFSPLILRAHRKNYFHDCARIYRKVFNPAKPFAQLNTKIFYCEKKIIKSGFIFGARHSRALGAFKFEMTQLSRGLLAHSFSSARTLTKQVSRSGRDIPGM